MDDPKEFIEQPEPTPLTMEEPVQQVASENPEGGAGAEGAEDEEQ